MSLVPGSSTGNRQLADPETGLLRTAPRPFPGGGVVTHAPGPPAPGEGGRGVGPRQWLGPPRRVRRRAP